MCLLGVCSVVRNLILWWGGGPTGTTLCEVMRSCNAQPGDQQATRIFDNIPSDLTPSSLLWWLIIIIWLVFEWGKIVLHLLSIEILGSFWDVTWSFGMEPKLRPSQTPTIHPSRFFWHIPHSEPNWKTCVYLKSSFNQSGCGESESLFRCTL